MRELIVVAVLSATTVISGSRDAPFSGTATAQGIGGLDGQAVGSRGSLPTEMFGFRLGDERRYVMGPPSHFQRPHPTYSFIRDDMVLMPGQDAAGTVVVRRYRTGIAGRGARPAAPLMTSRWGSPRPPKVRQPSCGGRLCSLRTTGA